MGHKVIDVHVVSHDGDRADWLADCLNSMRGAPINIHMVPRVEGDIRLARLHGYTKGSAPYVSYVDPDDVVLPGCYERLLAEIEAEPKVCGVYGLSGTMNEDGERMGLIHPYREFSEDALQRCVQEIHQPFVVRRDSVLTIFKHHYHTIPPISYTDVIIFNLLAKYQPWKAIDFEGYVWRIHKNSSSQSITAEENATGLQTWAKINELTIQARG